MIGKQRQAAPTSASLLTGPLGFEPSVDMDLVYGCKGSLMRAGSMLPARQFRLSPP